MGKDCIFDMRVVNTEVVSYLQKTPKKSLDLAERDKNCKYLESYLQQRCHFSLYLVSVYGILGIELEATLKRLASRLVKNWWQPYSQT